MSNFDLISKLFHEHIEYPSLSADTIVDAAENIASQIANAIVSERKVFSVHRSRCRASVGFLPLNP